VADLNPLLRGCGKLDGFVRRRPYAVLGRVGRGDASPTQPWSHPSDRRTRTV